MILTIVMMTVIIIGIAGMLRGDPPHPDFTVWSDDVERRLLRERTIDRRP